MSSPKKNMAPLTRGQMATGTSNATQDSISGFLNVEAWDFIHLDIVGTGSASMDYEIQSVDAFGNIVNLHTGAVAGASSEVIQLDPCPRKVVRSNVSTYGGGGLSITANLGKYTYS